MTGVLQNPVCCEATGWIFGAIEIQLYVPWVEYDTKSIFKRNTAGLNSEFSFSQTGWLTKAKEHSLSYYLSITGEDEINPCLSQGYLCKI